MQHNGGVGVGVSPLTAVTLLGHILPLPLLSSLSSSCSNVPSSASLHGSHTNGSSNSSDSDDCDNNTNNNDSVIDDKNDEICVISKLARSSSLYRCLCSCCNGTIATVPSLPRDLLSIISHYCGIATLH
jgi:hypothetical protein